MASISIYIALISVLLLPRNAEFKKAIEYAKHIEDQEVVFSNLIKDYKTRNRPIFGNGDAVKVYTSLFVYSITSIDEKTTDFTMHLLYRQTWHDDRLKFPRNATISRIHGDNFHATNIWTPDVHAVNDKEIGAFSDVSQGTVLLQIDRDGKVLLSKRVKLRPFCMMEFYKYPMDKQRCTLKLESSILPISDFELYWSEEAPLDLHPHTAPAGFVLANHSLERSITYYRQTGNFSRITASFDLQREFGHFVLDVYIPSVLFVVTSWLSFWVEIPAAPARVTLSMTTMLTLVTSEKAVREKLPKVSYVHALDIWNVVCTAFVFASLMEYSLVNYIYHRDKRRKSTSGMKRVGSTATFSSIGSDVGSARHIFLKKGETEPGVLSKKAASFSSLTDTQHVNCSQDEYKKTSQDIANSIDRKCRYIFPIGFSVFNVIYWLVLWL